MTTKHRLGIVLLVIGGIGLACNKAMALYLYLPNTKAKVLACILMLGIGVFLTWKSKVLANGVLRGTLHR